MHFCFKTALFCSLLVISQLATAVPAKRKKPAQQPPPPPVQEVAPAPAPPPTPEEMPPSPPQVTMQHGMLSITAENSTMGDILNAVRKQTGAVLETPPGLSSERVAANLGPGTPQSVVQQLFAGSRFDYIIVGSAQNPGTLQRIIVTARSGGTGAPNVASNGPINPPQNTYQPAPDVSEQMDEEPQPEPEPAAPEPPQVTPPTQAQPYSNQPKTPEQLLQELQQMQQQQQGRPPRPNVQGPPPQQPE